jgi:LCP family protein required for cell wall assembly
MVVGLVLVLLVLSGYAGLRLMLHRVDSAVPRATLLAPDARVATHADIAGPLNFLLIGSDYRVFNPAMGERSDTIIVLHVDQTLSHAYLVSIPRDLRVDIPPSDELNFPGATTKINAAFEYGKGGEGGIRLLSQTLTDLMGIRFDGAAVVNFGGLEKVVAALGGVRLCVDVRTVSIHTGAVFDVGCRHMSPAQVMDYLRQRESLPDSDFGRQRHQQQFLKAVFTQMTSAGTLTNPVKLNALLNAISGAFTADTGGASIPDLAWALRGLRPDAITGVRIPYYFATIDNISYVMATDEADSLYAAVRADSMAEWTAEHKEWVNKI